MEFVEFNSSTATVPSLSRRLKLGLFLLSSATLAFEITLTRVFSVAQFYHFAFMIVSIALLGLGASGTAIAIFPALRRIEIHLSLGTLGLATGLSLLGAYLLTNWLPFDSFSIAWDGRQIGILVLHYIVLAIPFFFSGMAVGLLLAIFPGSAGHTYSVNLLGSALGCGICLVAPSYLSGEGVIVLGGGMAALSSLICLANGNKIKDPPRASQAIVLLVSALLLMISILDIGLRLNGQSSFPFLELRLSPYKGLAYAMQQPGAEVIYHRWNSFSRLDVVRSASIHSIPGLSYRYQQTLPRADGLFVDGDELSSILLSQADPALAQKDGEGFTDYLPAAIAYHLRPKARVLILEPRGGLDIYTAISLGAEKITAVEVNSLIVEAARKYYYEPRVQVAIEAERSYIRHTQDQYDIVVLSLASSFHPVRSGAYSLVEDYRYTVESFQDILKRLRPEGLFIITRWLQYPPSEDLRTFTLAVTAIESVGASPDARIIAIRGYNTVTIVVKQGDFTPNELDTIRSFTTKRAFDLIYAPGIRAEETNRYNILPESIYYQVFTEFLNTASRQAFYASYPYDITPPTDDRPFFSHYFKWSQAGQILAELGRTWQPFGGAGYFVLVALLLLAACLSVILILLPLVSRKQSPEKGFERQASAIYYFLYFALIGFAYLLVEIPLIQRFILYLGHPAYAMTTVLFTLLLFSGLGSNVAQRINHRLSLGLLIILLLVSPLLLPSLFALTLGLPLVVRLMLTVIILAPVGFLMGIPFPAGIHRLTEEFFPTGPGLRRSNREWSAQIPWIWAVNGASSVISSILAALLALSFGFGWVERAGAFCYGGAWLAIMAMAWQRRFQSLHQ